MTSSVRLILFRDKAIRIKRKEAGCLIFDSTGTVIRADSTTWEFLNMIEDGLSFDETVEKLTEIYRMPAGKIKKDIEGLRIMLEKIFSINID